MQRKPDETRLILKLSVTGKWSRNFLRRRESDHDTALKIAIGERHGLKRSAAIEAIDRELEKRGLKSAKPTKA